MFPLVDCCGLSAFQPMHIFVYDSEVSNAKISYWQDKGKLAIAQKGIH